MVPKHIQIGHLHGRVLSSRRARSRRSGKHLPAREKNWSSAVPYSLPSRPLPSKTFIPKQRSQRVRHYGSSSPRPPDPADTTAPHRPRRADATPLLGGVVVLKPLKLAGFLPSIPSVLPAASYGGFFDRRDRLGSQNEWYAPSGTKIPDVYYASSTQPLQRSSSPLAPQLKPSSNRFEPTAQHSGSP